MFMTFIVSQSILNLICIFSRCTMFMSVHIHVFSGTQFSGIMSHVAGLARLFTALYFFVFFFSINERAVRTTRKLDASAKRKKQGGGGRGAKKIEGL